MTISERAQSRFKSLRREMRTSYERVAREGWSAPEGLCISAVARVVSQEIPEPGLSSLTEVQAFIASKASFNAYPTTALHISLLGCTQRVGDGSELDCSRGAKIVEVVTGVLSGHDPFEFRLHSLNVLGLQAFVEVVPADERWSAVRRALGAELADLGEEPIIYADTEPVHLNLGTFADGTAGELVAALSTTPVHVDQSLRVNMVEVVITDFSLSPDTFRVLGDVGVSP